MHGPFPACHDGSSSDAATPLRRIAVELSRLEASGQKVAVIIMNHAAAHAATAGLDGQQQAPAPVGQVVVDRIREARSTTATTRGPALHDNVQLFRPDCSQPVTPQLTRAMANTETPPLTLVECPPLPTRERLRILDQPAAAADQVRYFFLEFAAGGDSEMRETVEPLNRWEPGATVYLNGGEPRSSLVQLAIVYLQRVLSTAAGATARL